MGRKTNDQDQQQQPGQGATAEKAKVKRPPLYAVLLVNDDYTPMDFVILVLQKFFDKTEEEASRLMLQVHEKGHAVCGIFTREIAETKAARVVQFAQEQQHPLQTRIVPA